MGSVAGIAQPQSTQQPSSPQGKGPSASQNTGATYQPVGANNGPFSQNPVQQVNQPQQTQAKGPGQFNPNMAPQPMPQQMNPNIPLGQAKGPGQQINPNMANQLQNLGLINGAGLPMPMTPAQQLALTQQQPQVPNTPFPQPIKFDPQKANPIMPRPPVMPVNPAQPIMPRQILPANAVYGS
jgi:hypothetical protein